MLWVSGCGFHLRGTGDAAALPEIMERTYLTAPGRARELEDGLRRSLAGAGAEIVDQRAAATAILEISNVSTDRRVLVVDEDGRAREVELTYRVDFRLLDAAGDAVTDRQTVELIRDLTFDPVAVLARGEEEDAVRQEMERDAVAMIIQRVRAQAADAEGH